MFKRPLPTWIVALGVILVLQTVSASLHRLVPVAGPAFTAEFGWDSAWIGYLTAFIVIGALFALTSGIGIMHRIGGVFALQLSLLFGASSLLLYLFPSLTLAIIASLCIGLGGGFANPAGSEVLQRYTPLAHRNLVFSIKQAGVPLGGILGGLLMAPLIETVGWRYAAVVAAAACSAAILATFPFRARIDPPADERVQKRLVSFRLTDLMVPIRSLSRGDRLWRASWVGCMLAIPQAGWITFLVAYLVVALGQSLSTAGLVFAVMQTSSMFGRVTLGWIADRTSGPITLMVGAVASAASTMLLALSTPAWPLWAFLLLSAFAGIAVSGWNGVQIAEVARRSPPELVGETAAGSVILIFASNMLTPVVFAAFIAATARFDIAFMISGAFSLVCLPLLYGIDRGPPAQRIGEGGRMAP